MFGKGSLSIFIAVATLPRAESWLGTNPATSFCRVTQHRLGPRLEHSHTRREFAGPLEPSTASDEQRVEVLQTHHHLASQKEAAEAQIINHLKQSPFIGVLRGIRTADVVGTVRHLHNAGLSLLSIPADSPAGLRSLRRLHQRINVPTQKPHVMLGAATITTVEQVDQAADYGASFISCPHTEPAVIQRAIQRGLVVMPGIMTPSEAFSAIKHGATILKMFPSPAIPVEVVRCLKAVLPPHIKLLISGGVQPESVSSYIRAGVTGFALGSTLYRPDMTKEEVKRRVDRYLSVSRSVKEEVRLATPGGEYVTEDNKTGFLGDPMVAPVYGWAGGIPSGVVG